MHRLRIRIRYSTVMSSIPRLKAFISIATWVQITSLSLCFPLFPVSLKESKTNCPHSTPIKDEGQDG